MKTDTMKARLVGAREMAGLSAGQAARLTGTADLVEVEAGHREPTDADLARLADVYGVSITWLESGWPEVPLDRETVSKLREADIEFSERQSLITLLEATSRGVQ